MFDTHQEIAPYLDAIADIRIACNAIPRRALLELHEKPFERFWLVWSPTGPTTPRYRHTSEDGARAEAQRLAGLHPRQEFFVAEMKTRTRAIVVTMTDEPVNAA